MKPKIAIIHPEGNISNNQNLSGIVEILCEHGYSVDIYSKKRNIAQGSPCEGAKLILKGSSSIGSRIIGSIKGRLANTTKTKIFRNNNRIFDIDDIQDRSADFILGIDRNGIIDAAEIASRLNIRYGLISYEIFFRDECGSRFKRSEIEACKNVEFAVCQDDTRSALLSKENYEKSISHFVDSYEKANVALFNEHEANLSFKEKRSDYAAVVFGSIIAVIILLALLKKRIIALVT